MFSPIVAILFIKASLTVFSATFSVPSLPNFSTTSSAPFSIAVSN